MSLCTEKISSSVSLSLLNSLDTPLVLPVITPRFVPTCTSELMLQLGNLAKLYNLPIQSHLNESINEIDFVKHLHPECTSYTHVYQTYNLLNNNNSNNSVSYMAHGCYCQPCEIDILKNTKTG